MTTVIISERYRVKIDALNHTLEKLTEGGTNPKTGEPTEPRWVVEGYFPNMGQCLRRVITLELSSGNDVVEFHEYMDMYRLTAGYLKPCLADPPEHLPE